MSTSTPVRSASSKAAPLRSASKKTRHGSILNTAGAPSSQPSSGSLSFSLMSPRETSSVPDVEWTRDGDRRILRWASLKQILQCYSETSTAPDTLSLRHLILAHAHFVQSSALLDQLIKAYNRLSDPSGIPTASQMRLLNVVKTWIEMCYPALVEDPVCKKLLESFTAHLAATPSTAGLANLLNAAIESYKSKLNSPVRLIGFPFGPTFLIFSSVPPPSASTCLASMRTMVMQMFTRVLLTRCLLWSLSIPSPLASSTMTLSRLLVSSVLSTMNYLLRSLFTSSTRSDGRRRMRPASKQLVSLATSWPIG